MGVLLQTCYIFSEQLFPKNTSGRLLLVRSILTFPCVDQYLIGFLIFADISEVLKKNLHLSSCSLTEEIRLFQSIPSGRERPKSLQIHYSPPPRRKLPLSQGWGLGQSQVQFQGWVVTRQLPPRKIAPQLQLGFELRLVLGLGANFLGGNCPRTIFIQSKSIYIQ